ncbi:hypothetical protein LTR85_002004 [Meristemomyces frigidus]|nr:hypothetical protein LTR85_002004 [Meristemomyces frigidus]
MPQKRKAITESRQPCHRKRRSPDGDPYKYDTLDGDDEIRVLILEPATHDDPLRGELKAVSMADTPVYKAISYAWGPADFPFELQLASGILKITESLHGALRRFRSEKEPVALWADAVCINQNNFPERNSQVGFMADIYAEAEEVLVWLGESTRADTVAFWMVTFLSDFYQRHLRTDCDLSESNAAANLEFHFEQVTAGSGFMP